MNLPKFKQLAYISPSSFMTWENCQFHTYITRLAGFPFIKRTVGLAAHIGTAFDLFIKDKIERELNLPKFKKLTLGCLFADRVPEEFREEAQAVGRQLATLFINNNHLDLILNHRGDVVVDREMYGRVNQIPILGIPDISLDSVPIDLKTRGFISEKGAYPRKGWSQRWDYNFKTGQLLRREENPAANDSLYEPWKIQMLFYNWLLQQCKEKEYLIIEICKHGETVSIVTHKGAIEDSFSKNIIERLYSMWTAIHEKLLFAEINEPLPRVRKCERYGTICEAAHLCKFYLNTLAIPERRANHL